MNSLGHRNLKSCTGLAFAASVWLNQAFLGTSFGKWVLPFTSVEPLVDLLRSSTNNRKIIEETDDKFAFPGGSLVPGDNVITIVQVGCPYRD